MYLAKTPAFFQTLFPDFVWQIPSSDKTIYLTFDDGPVPEVTPWVLDLLEQYQAKATFFCVGENVVNHPDIYDQIIRQGHSVGNHTHNHLNGWSTDVVTYANNVRKCAHHVRSRLFRPPYGRLRPRQARFLKKHFDIVLWDVLSGDFDPGLTAAQCWKNVRNNASAGSVIVFHDSVKAAGKLREVLPRTMAYFGGLGYGFRGLVESGE